MDWNTQNNKDVNLPKLIYSFKGIPIKISKVICYREKQAYSKIYMERHRS